MPLRLTKKPDGAIITFNRNDGTSSSSRARDNGLFATHDLMHYAVESTLGYDNAFLGLLAQGTDIDEWEDAKSELRTNPPAEAGHAEVLVGMLHLKASTDGIESLRTARDELNDHVAMYFRDKGEPPSPVTGEQLADIAVRYQDLLIRWASVPVGESLELPWPA